MLERLPSSVGHALRNVRPGLDKILLHDPALAGAGSLLVHSRAFAYGAPLPLRYTADGDGLSPPIQWLAVPDATRSVAVVIEDADSPTPRRIQRKTVSGQDLAARGTPARSRKRPRSRAWRCSSAMNTHSASA